MCLVVVGYTRPAYKLMSIDEVVSFQPDGMEPARSAIAEYIAIIVVIVIEVAIDIQCEIVIATPFGYSAEVGGDPGMRLRFKLQLGIKTGVFGGLRKRKVDFYMMTDVSLCRKGGRGRSGCFSGVHASQCNCKTKCKSNCTS